MESYLDQKDTMKQFLQKQPHRLTVAKHRLGIHQMRVMARTVEALQSFRSFEVDHSKKQEDVWIEVKVSELVVGNNVKPLREALESLMKKVVRIMHYIPQEANYLEMGMPIIQAYRYKHGSETVELQISGHLLPQIVDLACGYTKYSVNVAFNTSSPNVFKLYQYIAHFRDKKQIQCNVSTLREWLQIEKKYSTPAKIKEWILNPAMRDLKQKADVWFDIAERVMEGRKMIGWRFNIYTRKSKAESLLDSKETPKQENTELKKRLMETYKLGKLQAQKVITWLGNNAEKCKELQKTLYEIQLMIVNQKLQNIGAYSVKVLGERLGIKL